ncbi:MAG: hypothetical protein JW881_12785 [Spirochaetales bacterium]|nr:hypothetical protein [Spirochaetales bacterium]
MKRLAGIIAVFLCFLSLYGCRGHAAFLFLLREYRHELLLNDTATYQEITNACRKNNIEPRFIVVEKDEDISFKEYIEASDAGIVLLDSMLHESPMDIAKAFDTRLFVTLRKVSGENVTQNLLSVVFDRKKGFAMAGELTARLLEGGITTGETTSEVSGGGSKKAGIIVYALTEEMNRENEAFMNGFSTVLDESAIVLSEIENINDRVKIKNTIDDMRNDGVVIYFLRAFMMNSYCLEYLKDGGGLAILEEWNLSTGYDDIVLMSLDDDIGELIGEVFRLIGVPDNGKARWKERVLMGDIKILWGRAAEWPEYLSDRFVLRKKTGKIEESSE